MIKIQKDNFNVEEEILNIKHNLLKTGSVSTFIGYVRNENNNKKVNSIELEVYKEMAHQSLKKILQEATLKWNLFDTLVIHRYGKLNVGEKIVLVATFSKHRENSHESCSFIMDHLKKYSPFWKKENYDEGYSWLQNTNLKS